MSATLSPATDDPGLIGSSQRRPFLSTLPAGPREQQLAFAVVVASCLVFIVAAPAARQPLPPIPAFLPAYQTALVMSDLITAVLLFGQFGILRSRALLVLASGYLFSALMAVSHALSFPGLFAPAGLLGAGAQTTAWIYFLWHGGFPLLIIAYCVLAGKERGGAAVPGRSALAISGAVAAVFAVTCALTLFATAGHDLLPPIMQGDRDADSKIYVAAASWVMTLAALLMLWRRRPHTVLDLWLAVVMCVWIFDIALAAVLNAGRYDLGWYAGRIYGLLAGSFVLVVLLLESGRMYVALAEARDRESQWAQNALARHAERLRILDAIDRAIVAGDSPEEIAGAAIRPLRELLGVPRAIVNIFDLAAGTAEWLAAAGRRRTHVGPGVRYSIRFMGDVQALRRGEPQRVDTQTLPPGPETDALLASGVRQYLVVPMLSGGELIGALSFGGESSVFPPEQIRISQEVATQLAIAIGQAQLLQRVRMRETETSEANSALRQSEARLQTVVENLAEGVVVCALDGELLHWNRAAQAMHDLDGPGEALRQLPAFAEVFELSAPDGTPWPVELWPLARVLRGETLRDLEVRVRHRRHGWQRVFAYGGALARDTDGRPLLAVVTMRDVTERREAERRIRGQLEHLNLLDHITRAIGERQDLKSIFQVVVRSLEDSLPVDFGCVYLHDAAANALRVECVGAKSEALAHLLTMDEGGSIDVDANGLSRCIQGQLVYEPDIGRVRFPFPERLARGGLGSVVMAPLRSESRVFGVLAVARREVDAFSSVECEFLRQLSEHVALAAHQSQLYGALQQAYDDLRQTQETAMQQERLRALGQMASGIAHDINNALSPVSLYTESMLETEQNLSERARGYLETIQRAVDDVAQTVARMREFYRQREVQIELAPVHANELVRQVVDLTRPRWSDMAQSRGTVVRVLTALAPDLPKIMGVESEIREALTNLVFNAVDAMPEGGTLTLRTRRADGDSQRPAVVVEVADSGVGMDEETRRRCLEPFFTTKGERGTGLGLAMVFGVVQRHSADLDIESAPGAGTTVRMTFAVAATDALESAPMALPPPSRLRLLLVDDDPILLKSLRDALETDGHVIVAASGGEAGIAEFRASVERGEPHAAVITDLGMPYVDGRKVAAAIKQASPATPVILLTGWGRRMVAEGEIPPHVDRVLAKPPKLRELREALARLCRPQFPEEER